MLKVYFSLSFYVYSNRWSDSSVNASRMEADLCLTSNLKAEESVV